VYWFLAKSEDKELIKELEEIPIKEFYLTLAQGLRLIGEYVKKMAELQRNPVTKLTMISQPSRDYATALGLKTIRELDADKIGPLLKTLTDMPAPTPNALDPRQGTPEEKTEYGDKCIALAEKIERILE